MPSLTYSTTVTLQSVDRPVANLVTAVSNFLSESDHYEAWSLVKDDGSIHAPLSFPRNDFLQAHYIEVEVDKDGDTVTIEIVARLESGARKIPADERERVHASVDDLVSELRALTPTVLD